MTKLKHETGVIILSAGFSSRMGKPKAFLEFNDELSFIEKISQEYQSFGVRNIIIVRNNIDNWFDFIDKNKNIETVINKNPEKGRFSSIILGINKLIDKEFIFIQNIDNPFVNQQILSKIYNSKEKNSYVSPVYELKGGHPILVHKNIFTQILNKNNKNQNLKHILQPFKRINVLINNKNILLNINTQEDYYKHIKLKQ